MNIFTRFVYWRKRRRVLKMVKHAIIILNAFNHALSKAGVNRALRHRYMRAISHDPKALMSLYYEIMGPSDGGGHSRVG